MKHIYLLLLALMLSGCQLSDDIMYRGSNTVKKPIEFLAKAFMEKNPNIKVVLDGYGSDAFHISSYNVYGLSREMKPVEKEWSKRHGPVEQEIFCYDALAIIVHRDNPVNKLTLAELKDIFMGKIKNWSEVGGEDAPIAVVVRSERSGSEDVFKEKVLKGEDLTGRRYEVITYDKTIKIIAAHQYGIAYVSIGYVNNKVKVVALAKDDSSPGILPERNNIADDTYPITRPLYMLTVSDANSKVKQFIKFVLSDEGQSIVEKVGLAAVDSRRVDK